VTAIPRLVKVHPVVFVHLWDCDFGEERMEVAKLRFGDFFTNM
jgi:hypothetical protein